MADIIRPAHWRAPPPASEVILVARMATGDSWQVWHWSPEYELGAHLGLPQTTLEEAEEEARTWAAAYRCDWIHSSRPINDDGEMV